MYGCELWGFGNVDIIERVQLKFFKHILCLKKSTPSFMIYGELGVYPLSVDIQTRVISYWTKLSIIRTNDTAFSMYDILHSLNKQGKLKTRWLDNIKNLICINGYGNVWNGPSEINPKWFISSFKQKLKDEYVQTWRSLIDKSSSSLNYRIFKDNFEMSSFFDYLTNENCRILTAFRTRNHRLPVEIGRWSSIPINERICNLCNNGIGDEYHYILECNALTEQRRQFIKPYYRRHPNT